VFCILHCALLASATQHPATTPSAPAPSATAAPPAPAAPAPPVAPSETVPPKLDPLADLRRVSLVATSSSRVQLRVWHGVSLSPRTPTRSPISGATSWPPPAAPASNAACGV